MSVRVNVTTIAYDEASCPKMVLAATTNDVTLAVPDRRAKA
ncbi:MAG TPA: hypothetical protein VMU98_07720 [Acidimicrobiales bacterium]|nr:hypothetical protein [Acidimicrobiales bacterium]